MAGDASCWSSEMELWGRLCRRIADARGEAVEAALINLAFSLLPHLADLPSQELTCRCVVLECLFEVTTWTTCRSPKLNSNGSRSASLGSNANQLLTTSKILPSAPRHPCSLHHEPLQATCLSCSSGCFVRPPHARIPTAFDCLPSRILRSHATPCRCGSAQQ